MLGVVEERRQLTHDLRVARAERNEIKATMEVQTAKIQELEVRVLEERQRADASHAQLQKLSKCSSKAAICREISGKKQSVKLCLKPINKVDISSKTSFSAVLGCFHRYS